MTSSLPVPDEGPDDADYGWLFAAYMAGALETSLARVRAEQGQPSDRDRRQAWHALSYALKVDLLWPLACELLLVLAPKLEAAGFREDWLAYLQRGMDEARAHGDRRALAELGYHAGTIYRYLDRHDDADAVLLESREIAAAHAMPLLHALVLNQLAYVAYERERYPAAKQYALEALVIPTSSDSARATAKGMLGILATEAKAYEEAISLHLEALTIRRRLNERRTMAWSLQNIGRALNLQGRHDEAILYLREAVAILESLQDEYHLAIVRNNLGEAFRQVGEYEAAMTQILDARRAARRLGATKPFAYANLSLGLTYLALERFTEAIPAFAAAVESFGQISTTGEELNAADGLALAYMANGEYARAEIILERLLDRLPDIADIPYHYDYLLKVVPEHLRQARAGAGKTTPA
jgi:tetratricopeptide (TPR) repeat protein